ncbi:hypothetical protein FC959_03480 [Clostridium botulinum]|nr:hypothetical protein [Clostridium botulinum]
MEQKVDSPLAIVAIFAGLAEIAGTTVLAFLPDKLQNFFIWYVMLFPVILLILFFITWNFNSKVLYPPNQFKYESNYMKLNRADTMLTATYEEISDLVDDDSLDENTSHKVEATLTRLDQHLLKEDEQKQKSSMNEELEISINGTKIYGKTVPQFYENIMNYLIKNRIDFDKFVPYATGRKRYLISKDKVHISGEKFWSPICIDNYYLETHKSRVGAINDMKKFLKKLKIQVE